MIRRPIATYAIAVVGLASVLAACPAAVRRSHIASSQ